MLLLSSYSFGEFLGQAVESFWHFTGFYNCSWTNLVMLAVGCFFVYLAIKKNFEPLLLVPIGFGMLVGNIPFQTGMEIGIYEPGSVLNILYNGVEKGWYPPLVFLGVGAMTDFSALLANPKLMVIGGAAQFGIFGAYMLALLCGFDPLSAGCVAIIGGADGPTAIFTTSKLNPALLGAVAVSAYSYMALIPLIQPPIMRLLTTDKERKIKMKPARVVSQNEKILFPIVGLILTCFIVPSGIPLLGMLFFGNLLRESGVTTRLAKTASTAALIFRPGFVAFILASTAGVLSVKVFNLFLRPNKKINPLIGNAGVSAVPMAARISNNLGLEYDPSNYLLMHAMGPNVAGVIGSAVAAGVLLSFLG